LEEVGLVVEFYNCEAREDDEEELLGGKECNISAKAEEEKKRR
jgi:hypothetical protein